MSFHARSSSVSRSSQAFHSASGVGMPLGLATRSAVGADGRLPAEFTGDGEATLGTFGDEPAFAPTDDELQFLTVLGVQLVLAIAALVTGAVTTIRATTVPRDER